MPANKALRCDYVYKGHEGACRDLEDRKTGNTIKARKNAGDKCNAIAMKGKKKCIDHGGKSARPIIHGNYSQALHQRAKRTALRFDEVLKDPKALLSLEQDVALIRTFAIEELEGLPDEGEDAFLWGQAKKVHWLILKAAEDKREGLLKRLGEILNNGQAIEHRKGRVMEMQEHMRRMIDTENKKRAADASNLTQKDLVIAAVRAMGVISANVEDNGLCEKIALELKAALFGDNIQDAEFTEDEPDALPVRAQ